MAKRPTWTTRGVTHQRNWGVHTLCGLPVPYKAKNPNAKRPRRRVQKDKKPRQVTCIDCLAMMDEAPTHVRLNDIRGLSADYVFYDEAR